MNRPPAGRLAALFVALVIGFAGIVVRLGFLQVRDAGTYQDLATQQRVRVLPLPATRGAIQDRFGRDLALSLDARAIYADPRYVSEPSVAAEKLAPLLKTRPIQLEHLLKGDGSFVYLARQVDRGIADRVARLNLPGIGFLQESKRHYPAGSFGAPQVLGFVGIDGAGLSGLELEYQDLLDGEDGERQEEIDPSGRGIPQGVDLVRPPVAGEDLVTTIDPHLQFQAQLSLEDAVRRNGAKGGTVVVLDPDNGDILAMASYPWFDPNRFGSASEENLENPAVTTVYEPGSVNKVITVSAALEENQVRLNERFDVPDKWRIGDAVFHDAHPHAPMSMTINDIVTQSSNVGVIRVAAKVGPDLMASYLARFGFGQETGVGFPGELEGIIPSRYRYWDTTMATIPIGQGLAVTPLQMAQVYAVIANGGEWVQPRLVRGTTDQAGKYHPVPAQATRRVVSEKTADLVTRMLANVVRTGTGTEAQIPGYWVAGKTGTAQKPKTEGPGYTRRFVGSFIGFLPSSDPQIVIAAILDEPALKYGGVTAAPLFQQIGKEAIARLRIPPGERPRPLPSAAGGR
ncbi:MAG: penicillin-binding protein 2 [Actinomycetota bacterium]